MRELNLYYTDIEFIDEVLKRSGKKEEDFVKPLFEDKHFMMLSLCHLWDDTYEVIERISDKLWDDIDFCVSVFSYICDDLDYYMNKIPEKHFNNLWFVSTLVSFKTEILEYIPNKYLNNSFIFTEALLSMDVEDKYDWKCDEFMYIVDKIPELVWEDVSFVYDLITYSFEIHFDDRFTKFLDYIPSKYWKDEDFIIHVCNNINYYEFKFIVNKIDTSLKNDIIFMDYLYKEFQ